MKKQTLVLIPIITVIVVGLGAGSFWFYDSLQKHTSPLGEDNSSLASAGEEVSGSAAVGSSAQQIGVSTASNASSMGQLNSSSSQSTSGASTSGQSAVTTSPTATAAGSNTSSSESAALAHLLDPTTFSKYDVPQYIDGASASYVDLITGTGATLVDGDTASVYYKGWLTDGTLFDETKADSSGQMQPFDFSYGTSPSAVIGGWQQGMEGMKVGGVRLLIIPPAVGYGSAGNASIPGNAVLIFQVQLAGAQQ
jgi:FKBP-type peptidyl-prolyl cis-trans isomerase FkpA